MTDDYGSGDTPGGGDIDTGTLSPETILEHLSAQADGAALFPGSMREVWFFAYDLLLDQSSISRFVKKMAFGKVVSLPHYRLDWPYYYPPLGTSLPSLKRTNDPADAVWGFIYDARERDFTELERYLRVPNRYHRTALQVQDRGGRRFPAFSYVLTIDDDVPRPPAAQYRDELVAAAAERKLPEEWLETLRKIEVEQAELSGGAV